MLVTFGKVQLEGLAFSRPKPLLLLSFLTVAGPQERRRLATLFWPDDGDGDAADAAALRRKLGKLSVVLAQFRKAGAGDAFPAKAGADPLHSLIDCDALAFGRELAAGNLEAALAHYRGPFLADLGRPLAALGVAETVRDWVLETRERLAADAWRAMLELAESALAAGDPEQARSWAERASSLAEAPEPEAADLARLHRLLRDTGSQRAGDAKRSADAILAELSPTARQVLLALALQPAPNLTVIRTALGLALSDLDAAREELLLAGLIDDSAAVLAQGLARSHLAEHPSERMPLQLALARNTPPEEAYPLFHALYEATQGFGGVGDLPRAQAAYRAHAQERIAALAFDEAAAALAELRSVERLFATPPDPRCRFLEAYALERLGRFREALELVDDLSATEGGKPDVSLDPDLLALRSVLAWRCGRRREAQHDAEQAAASGLDWLWARATATTTLGYVASSAGELEQAARRFKKAASLYQAAGDAQRRIGSLNNHAVALDMMALAYEDRGEDAEQVAALRDEAERAYLQALEALAGTAANAVANPALEARIHLNLGVLSERRQDWVACEAHYLEAERAAAAAGSLDVTARLQLNLGFLYGALGRPNEARGRLEQAIATAADAGEYAIQGAAMANLAAMTGDLEAMETALELLGESGDEEHLERFARSYEAMVRAELERALSASDGRRARSLLRRLGELYARQERAGPAQRVEETLNALAGIVDPSAAKGLLLAMLLEQAEGSEGSGTEST